MSFHPIEQAPGRLNRSELAVPGSQPQMFEKAAQSDVDVIFLDLEIETPFLQGFVDLLNHRVQ